MPEPTPTPTDPQPSPEPAAELNAEPAGDPSPADVIPETGEGYTWGKLSEGAKAAWGGATADDPAIKAITEHAATEKWTQGKLDAVQEVMNVLADKGLLDPPFDAAAELAKMTGDGKARQAEQSVWLEALKEKGDLTEGEAAELSSLIPTADGLSALEKLRKARPDPIVLDPAPGGEQGVDGGEPGDTPEQAEARRLRRDPQYETDRSFRKRADSAFEAAFSRPKG